MTLYSKVEIQFCELCGKNITDYSSDRLQRVFKCPDCGKIVCVDCYYKHSSCDRGMCGSCVARKMVWRKSRRDWERNGYRFKFQAFEHPYGGNVCRVCGTTDVWIRIGDAIRFKIKHGYDKNETFEGIEG